MSIRLMRFQRDFERAVESDAYDTVVMSGPRSLGKSFLAGRILARCMTPGDVLHQPGKTYILGAATLETATATFGFIRETLETLDPTGYRYVEGSTRLGITHLATNTRLRVISSNAKGSFGLVRVPLVVLDEPGALDIVGGGMLADSLFSAQGKVGSPLKLILIGTLGPLATATGHWFYDLAHGGTKGRTWAKLFQGERKTWDNWNTIRRANPLISKDANTRAKLREEREAARGDSRLKARFMTYRLNVPTSDESETLLTPDEWETLKERPAPERAGQPVVGVDLAGGRAWASAVGIFPSGRIECFAVAAGLPDISEQERRDRVPKGLYQQLHNDGLLLVDEGLHVQRPETLWDEILNRWGFPALLIGDRFRESELLDVIGDRTPWEPRVWRWSEASEDIRALRRGALDGPFTVGAGADLLAASLSVAAIKGDDAGNVRLEKRSRNNTARDDVCAAWMLASGAWERMIVHPPEPSTYLGMINP